MTKEKSYFRTMIMYFVLIQILRIIVVLRLSATLFESKRNHGSQKTLKRVTLATYQYK